MMCPYKFVICSSAEVRVFLIIVDNHSIGPEWVRPLEEDSWRWAEGATIN
jgi:hypothetical protein